MTAIAGNGHAKLVDEGLAAEGLVRYYGKWRVVNDVTIDVRRGEVVGLLEIGRAHV